MKAVNVCLAQWPVYGKSTVRGSCWHKKLVKSPLSNNPSPARARSTSAIPTRTCAETSPGGENTGLRLRISTFLQPFGRERQWGGLDGGATNLEGRTAEGAWPAGRAQPSSSGLLQLRAHHPPPFFCGPAHCEGDRKPCAGSAAILDLPEEDLEGAAGAVASSTATVASRLQLLGQPATCRGLGRPPPPLSRCIRLFFLVLTPPSRPESCPATSNPPVPPWQLHRTTTLTSLNILLLNSTRNTRNMRYDGI
nr:ras-related protein Rab-14 isoform X1 [Vicugna pacos]